MPDDDGQAGEQDESVYVYTLFDGEHEVHYVNGKEVARFKLNETPPAAGAGGRVEGCG